VLLGRRLKGSGIEALGREMAEVLQEALAAGELLGGELIPSERELAARHGRSYVTIRKALAGLVRDGLLRKLPRVGYQVVGQLKEGASSAPVGLVSSSLGSGGGLGPSQLAAAIEAQLAELGRPLMIACSRLDAERESECIRRLRAAGVAGLVVRPAPNGERSRELEDWIAQGRPIVLQGHPGDWVLPDELAERCDWVNVDNAGGVRQALEYLTGLGHRRLAYASSDRARHSERLAAFRAFAREAGRPPERKWVLTGMPRGREGGRRAFDRLVVAGSRPTAVFCGSDDLALGLIEAAREAGMSVPGDLSVVGFGNESADGPGALKELTTLNFLKERDGAETVRLLDEQLRGISRRPERVRVPVHLVVRESCAPPREAKRRSRAKKPASARVEGGGVKS
jgi:DNA-binding LacI/PurR family transcriptional regulator